LIPSFYVIAGSCKAAPEPIDPKLLRDRRELQSSSRANYAKRSLA